MPGIWGSGLDVLLRAIRDVIVKAGPSGFPTEELERTMAARGKSLRASPELVDSLLELRYGDARAFPLLALLFDHVNTRNQHHVDHVFPAARLKAVALRQAGLSDDESAIVDRKDRLPNLELLEGLENISKSAKTPAEWASETMADPSARSAYISRNLLPADLPAGVTEFLKFYGARHELLRGRLVEILGVQADNESEVLEDALPPLDEALETEQLL